MLAAKAATTTMPIVFASGDDPVRGLVDKPQPARWQCHGRELSQQCVGRKATGAAAPDRTQCDRQLRVLQNPVSSGIEAERKDLLSAATVIGQQLVVLDVNSEREIETAFDTLLQRGARAVFVGLGRS